MVLHIYQPYDPFRRHSYTGGAGAPTISEYTNKMSMMGQIALGKQQLNGNRT